MGADSKEEYIEHEPRFVTMGTEFLGRVLVVVYTYRREAIRLVPARAATRRERRVYERKRI